MFTRRRLVLSSLAVSLAAPAVAQPPAKMRLSWPSFRASPDYPPYRAAIARMRANRNAADPDSWLYWANVHERYCPHHRAWFLAWHRGLLHLFERKLAELSGVPDLRLPYWDYYADPLLPAEFVAGGPDNPLWADRVGRSVAAALTLDPFGPAHVNFQEGLAGSFELALEFQPHNPVHNLIGGVMVTMQSPQDPIFWLHHANVDRLWTAWAAAGAGRTMPPAEADYWAGACAYAPGLTLPRRLMRDGRAAFGDVYESTVLPGAMPLVGAAPPPRRTSRPPSDGAAEGAGAAPPPPPPAAAYAPRALALRPGASLSLGSRSFSVQVQAAVPPRPRRAVRPPSGGAAEGAGAAPPPPPPVMVGAAPGGPRAPLTVILDGVDLTALGRRGGYYYKVYLGSAQAPADSGHLLGTLGAFEIAAARHAMAGMADMPARLEFPAAGPLAGLDPAGLVVSFVRVDGAVGPGETITVASFRIDNAG